ncbi:DUF1992 domain-containing protein [Nocardia sp. NPDC050406]|uniref:DUF1992 domain-containing protein n=1 Tax=Nocardia sp. NPDC050406 TaxID=3364318 RepID=UPI0037BC9E70
MVERKPPELDFETWIDKQIREATERGEFENLPGAGKPIPGAGAPVDENWWLHDYVRREGATSDVLLPPSLLLRRDIERLPQTVREMKSEERVRDTVSELNERIVRWLRMPEGPMVPMRPVDADEVVARWREERSAAAAASSTARQEQAVKAVEAEPAEHPARSRRWWRWRSGRA